ncbi:glycosyltransferase family 1 protein [Microcella alkalica]|uniref:rhamnosyltransferase WsaF family glycosyltransferase n=1 Tax=Microcella alkalica TaxID=355930 RepID=UPI00145EDFB5|nr:glycosyltransferase family 1 protein [Microcella alkalica]
MARFKLFRVLRPLRVLRDEGPGEFALRAARTLASKVRKHRVHMLVSSEDAAAVDWTEPAEHRPVPITVSEGPVDIAWIMSPPGDGSGGHQNLFRFIRFAEEAGHRCTVYFYSARSGSVSIADVRAMMRASSGYADVEAQLLQYDPATGIHDSAQAVFATGWETAYPVYRDRGRARRFYFVQDFEPSFYPLGSEAVLAENTYRFGFHGITAGGWLAHKLAAEYGMRTDHFDFAVDKTHYSVTNRERRGEVFFYARPVTARRGFELGVLALAEFARMKPDATINLAGWDVSNWELPFPVRNEAVLDVTELNALYNRCAAGLVMSLSNMSLLPLELMSSGVAPVVNDGPNNRMVSDNPFIEYVPLSPRAIARRMVEVIERPDQVERSLAMSASVVDVNWSDSGRQFLEAFERGMRG